MRVLRSSYTETVANAEATSTTSSPSLPSPILFSRFSSVLSSSLLDVHPQELAIQMTLRDHRNFIKIPFSEFLRKKPTKPAQSPNLQEMIKSMNIVSKKKALKI